MPVRPLQALRDAVRLARRLVQTGLEPAAHMCQEGARPGWSALGRMVWVLALCCAGFLSNSLARAQNVMVYEEGQMPVAQDVAEILSRGAIERLQQARLPEGGGAPQADPEPKPVTELTQASALSVPVQFAFDASSLTEKSRAQLSAIAEGIRLIDATLLVVIDGHTDARGRASYNKRLSLRRALAVRDFLVSEGKVAAKVLTVEGKGSQQLLDTAEPYNPRNCRIQFSAR